MMDCDGLLSPSHPHLLLNSPAGSLLAPRPPHISACPKNMPVPPMGHMSSSSFSLPPLLHPYLVLHRAAIEMDLVNDLPNIIFFKFNSTSVKK